MAKDISIDITQNNEELEIEESNNAKVEIETSPKIR